MQLTGWFCNCSFKNEKKRIFQKVFAWKQNCLKNIINDNAWMHGYCSGLREDGGWQGINNF